MSKKYKDAVLFVGPKSQMKQQLLNHMTEFNINCPIKLLDLYYGNKHDILLIKLKGLKLGQSSIIQTYIQLHDILQLGFKQLKQIYYVVKYDRIENMKTLIMPFLVKFRQYLANITIIVTGMELSDQQTRDQDKELILKELSAFFQLSKNNFIICNSTDDLSQKIIRSKNLISCSMDIKNLNLMPAQVDRQNIEKLNQMFKIDNTQHDSYQIVQKTPIFPLNKLMPSIGQQSYEKDQLIRRHPFVKE